MAEYIEREATNADVSEKTKIKTHFAHVIVERYHGKPYYNILYFDPTDKEYYIGFGSFSLDYVFKWLDEEFEIVEAPAADVVEKNCRGDELRRFLEDEIENSYDLLSDTMNPCFDGVIVGRGEAQVLRENHIRFCKRLLSFCD